MGKKHAVDPKQARLFDEDLLAKAPRGNDDIDVLGPEPSPALRRRQLELFQQLPPQPEARGDQLNLFHIPQTRIPPRRKRRLKNRLKKSRKKQTYLDLACQLGLPRLHMLLDRPATYFLVDAQPLQEAMGVKTLLDARYHIEETLVDAFEDLADMGPMEARNSAMSLWGGRRLGLGQARSPRGEALIVAIASEGNRVPDPFILRLRGLPGYLGRETGPSPFEEGEELISVYDKQTLYPLLPREAQPMDLERLLAG